MLNIRANKVHDDIVDNVHYEKNFGLVDIPAEAALEFCKKHFPSEYESVRENAEKNPGGLLVDFENVLYGMEQTPSYQLLPDIIRKQSIDSAEERGYVACFVFLHWLRVNAILNAASGQVGYQKFEYLWELWQLLKNAEFLYAHTERLLPAWWTLYKSETEAFPIGDLPVLWNCKELMTVLSPYLLLEIDFSSPFFNISVSPTTLTPEKSEEYRRRAISNSWRHIISGNASLLESWSRTREFQERRDMISASA